MPNHDELGQLAGKLNRMSQELDNRITQLTASHERQATVLGGMIEGVIAVDRRERVLFANAAAGRLFDFRPHAWSKAGGCWKWSAITRSKKP